MATFGQVGELVSTQLRDRVDRLVSAVEDDAPDFERVASLADEVGEFADMVAGIYSDLDETLTSGLRSKAGSTRAVDGSEAERQPRREQPRQEAEEDADAADEPTKEELLEQARELNVPGRSTMAKDELAEAVEAEESQTKDDLLERAREAGIEGRSAMTKKELRRALRESGA